MSTRWLVVVIAAVVAVVLAVALVSGRGDEAATPAASPLPGASTSVPSTPASPGTGPTASPSPSPTALEASSFVAGGDPVAGWFWLRDPAHVAAATWVFTPLPASGDLTFDVEVLATDEVDGPSGLDARLYFAWGPAAPDPGGDWYGRLPVTLPNVSPADDPVGYTCRGTVTVPRSTIGTASALTVRIGRDDVRGELPPIDLHLAVNADSVKLRLP